MTGLRRRFAPRMEIRLFANRVRLTNLDSGAAIERGAAPAFSTERMLVADAGALSRLIRAMLLDLEGGLRFLAWPSAVFVATEPLSPVERHVLADMGDAMGFRKTAFAD